MTQRVLLVLDMQNAILQKSIYEKEQLVENINALAGIFSLNNLPIVLSRHTNNTSLQSQPVGWEIDESIHMLPNAILYNKRRSNIFKENNFIQIVQRENIKYFFISGIATNGCVQAACVEGIGQVWCGMIGLR